jgi:DNA-binding winged helix-turn-helix (wHTH) protein
MKHTKMIMDKLQKIIKLLRPFYVLRNVLHVKRFDAIYFDTNVFIKRYVLSVAETTYRISKPMFRVLCSFHEHEGKVVSKKFLLAYGWGISNKVNSNVTLAISELRGLLKNIIDLEIITVHGKGYQLINKRRSFCE